MPVPPVTLPTQLPAPSTQTCITANDDNNDAGFDDAEEGGWMRGPIPKTVLRESDIQGPASIASFASQDRQIAGSASEEEDYSDLDLGSETGSRWVPEQSEQPESVASDAPTTFEKVPPCRTDEHWQSDREDDNTPSTAPTGVLELASVSILAGEMGSRSWTGLGEQWSQRLIDKRSHPAKVCRDIHRSGCNRLIEIRKALSSAPTAPKTAQERYLTYKDERLVELEEEADVEITYLEEGLQKPDKKDRKAVQAHVYRYTIPYLVLILRHICLLGGAGTVVHGRLQLGETGIFIHQALDVLYCTTRWLVRLATCIQKLVDHEIKAYNEGRRPGVTAATVGTLYSRVDMCQDIITFHEEVKAALTKVQEEIDAPRARLAYAAERREQDLVYQKARLAEVEAEEAKFRRRYRYLHWMPPPKHVPYPRDPGYIDYIKAEIDTEENALNSTKRSLAGMSQVRPRRLSGGSTRSDL